MSSIWDWWIVTGSVFRRRKRRCHAGRMHELPYFIFLIGVAVEKFFNVKRAAGWCFNDGAGTILFGWVKYFLRFNFILDFVFDISLFVDGFLERHLFFFIQITGFIFFLELMRLLLLLLHDISNKLLDVNLIVGKRIFFWLWEFLSICLESFIEILYSDKRVLNW